MNKDYSPPPTPKNPRIANIKAFYRDYSTDVNIIAGSLATLGVLVVISYLVLPHWWSGAFYSFHKGVWMGLASVAVIILVFLIGYPIAQSWYEKRMKNNRFEDGTVPDSVVLGVSTITVIGLIIGMFLGTNYSINAATREQEPIKYEAIDTEWDIRAPIDTAKAQAQFAVGDNPNATLLGDSLRYLPDNEQYSSLTHTRGIIKSYSQIVTQSSDLVGTNSPEVCQVDTDQAPLWLGGHFFNSLGRSIVSTPGHRMSTYDRSDAFGWCENGVPMISVPLYRARGALWNSHPVPDGVAVYNGHSGELNIHDSGEGIPGPTLPRIVAERSLEANRSENGFSDWLFKRYGYRAPNDAGTNIVLSRSNEDSGAGEFISKMIPARDTDGEGDPTTAIVKMSAVAPERGVLPQVTIERLGDRAWRPDQAIDAKIRNDYSNLQNWQEFSVHEIIPIDSHHFVATIGNDQNVRYRVIGRGDLGTLAGRDEGVSTCLYEGTNTEPLQCGQRAGRDDNSVGSDFEKQEDVDPNTGTDTDTPPSSELGDMSTQELIDSTRELLNELERRNDA